MEDVLRMMETSGKIKYPQQRCVVLSFDEMKIASLYDEYDKQKDEIWGPHSYMQVVMAKGLFVQMETAGIYWIWPESVTAELLITIIKKG